MMDWPTMITEALKIVVIGFVAAIFILRYL